MSPSPVGADLDIDALTCKSQRATMSRRDFREALDYLEKLRDAGDEIVQRGLLSAAIVSYARPFTRNRRGAENEATCTFEFTWPADLSARVRDTHDTIVRLRDTVVAHSDFDARPMRRVPAPGKSFVTRSQPFDLLAELPDRGAFEFLAGVMFTLASQAAADLNDQINRARSAETAARIPT